MSKASTLFSPAELQLTRTRPVAYVLRSTLVFAAMFSLFSLIAGLVVPAWADAMTPAHTLFVAVFGGLFGAVVNLMLARLSDRR
jgi:hypothetical protein